MNMDFFQFCCLKHAVDVNNRTACVGQHAESIAAIHLCHTACVGQHAESIAAIHLCFCANDSKLKGHVQLMLMLLLF
jgi:hypothetical protein